jgi:hypothetical protein
MYDDREIWPASLLKKPPYYFSGCDRSMLKREIQGARSVVVTGEMVYANLDDDLNNPNLVLIQGSKEIPFEPCTVSFPRRFDFDVTENVDVILEGKNSAFVSVPHLSVNTLRDWNVPGFNTLEIHLEKRDLAYRMTFRKQIVVEGAARPLSFRANIANHMARANLIVKFTNLDTQETEVHTVKFDPAICGGTTSDKYQQVKIAAPEGISSVAVDISIDYIGCTERENRFPPFLFIFDVHLHESGQEFSDGIFGADTLDGEWRRAKADANLEGFDYAFIRSGEETTVLMTKTVEVAWGFFDEDFYKKQNPDLDLSRIDAFSHYLLRGWKEFRNPNPELSVREYLLRHPDVDAAGTEPLIHYANIGQRESRSLGTFHEKVNEIWKRSGKAMPAGDATAIFERAQDMMVPMSIINSRKIAVFVVPEHDAMSGGIFSFFSIADHARKMRRLHGYDVLVMTRANPLGLTYVRVSAFRNSETVLRLEQLRLFAEVSELQIHIPEYATVDFVRYLSPDLVKYLLRRDCVHINIMNQNIRLMPESEGFRDLRRISSTIGQSVSHRAFFRQELADRYDLPTLLLPAYTDLSHYPGLGVEQKEKIIIYSNDDAPYRRAVLKRLEQLDDYTLVKIQDMTFDVYMDLATRCKFSVSFGEGFDGYVAQPMYQGGIGFALYNDEFFPNASYKKFENFFETEEEMIEEIVPTIRRLEADRQRYVALNKALRAKWDALYSYDDYVARILKLMRNEYEVFPKGSKTRRPAANNGRARTRPPMTSPRNL